MHFSLAQITNGDPQAQYYLKCWGDYLRAVDDTIDDALWTPENVLRTFAMGNRLYASNFYTQNIDKLQMIILTGTAIWEVSCDWEYQPELWKRQWGDFMRHSDVAMLSAVAMKCKGWTKAVEFIRGFLCGAFVDHKDRHGLPDDSNCPQRKVAASDMGIPVSQLAVNAPDPKVLAQAAAGDPLAFQFLTIYAEYFRDCLEFAIKAPSLPPTHARAAEFIALLARTCTVHSLPYHARNAHFLYLPIQQAFLSLVNAARGHENALLTVVQAVGVLNEVREPLVTSSPSEPSDAVQERPI